jgi:hypothetical protein
MWTRQAARVVRACGVRGLQTALSIACVAGGALGGTRAEAAPLERAGFTLTWQTPPQCPSKDDLLEDIARLVGELDGEEPNLVARARVTPEPGGRWRLLLETELDGTPGERELEGNSCDAVARAAAVMIALMLNPHATFEPEPTSEPLTTRLGIDSRLELSRGTMPSWSPELSLGVVGGWGRAWFRVGAGIGLPQRAELSGDSARGGDLWHGSGQGSLCWDLLGEDAVFGACGLVEVHRLQGRGRGIANPRTGVVWWTDAGLALVGRVPVTSAFALGAHVEGAVPLARPSLYVQGLGLVHQPKGLASTLGISALFQFR